MKPYTLDHRNKRYCSVGGYLRRGGICLENSGLCFAGEKSNGKVVGCAPLAWNSAYNPQGMRDLVLGFPEILSSYLITAPLPSQAHEAVIHGHHPAPEENLQVLAALRLQYLQGDYSLHTSVPPLEEVYSLQRLKARISQSTKTFTPYERLEKRRTSFLEGTLRRSFRTGAVVRQKAEEEQMLDMWIKEEVCSARASIIDKWKKLQGMNQEQAMAKYMALIKEWPGYGSTLFDVEVSPGGCNVPL